MPQRILKDVIQFLGLMCLLAAGTFGFYMAMVAYQLCSLQSQCPLYQFQQPNAWFEWARKNRIVIAMSGEIVYTLLPKTVYF
jgi:hypothetical protein